MRKKDCDNCGTCRFWKSNTGECRRFPPMPYHPEMDDIITTLESYWCGEWQEAEQVCDHIPCYECRNYWITPGGKIACHAAHTKRPAGHCPDFEEAK